MSQQKNFDLPSTDKLNHNRSIHLLVEKIICERYNEQLGQKCYLVQWSDSWVPENILASLYPRFKEGDNGSNKGKEMLNKVLPIELENKNSTEEDKTESEKDETKSEKDETKSEKDLSKNVSVMDPSSQLINTIQEQTKSTLVQEEQNESLKRKLVDIDQSHKVKKLNNTEDDGRINKKWFLRSTKYDEVSRENKHKDKVSHSKTAPKALLALHTPKPNEGSQTESDTKSVNSTKSTLSKERNDTETDFQSSLSVNVHTVKVSSENDKERLMKCRTIVYETCDICDQIFPSKSIKAHKLLRHKPKPVKPPSTKIAHRPRKRKPDTRVQCDICNKSLSRRYLKSHKALCHLNTAPHTCEVCGKGCLNRRNLEDHMGTHAYGPKLEYPFTAKVECDICKLVFNRNSLKLHKTQVHFRDGKQTCDICSKRFPNKSKLEKHKLCHSVDNFTCQYCDKKFKQHDSCVKHEYTHTKETDLICNVCQMNFKFQYDFKQHCLVEHESVIKMPICCPICKQKMRKPMSVYHHSTFHFKEKNISCEICGKLYSNKKSLRYHIKAHQKNENQDHNQKSMSEKPSVMLEQPSLATEQPSSMLEQPSLVSEHPSSTLGQSSSTSEQPSSMSEQPSSTSEQPLLASEQSSSVQQESMPKKPMLKPNSSSQKLVVIKLQLVQPHSQQKPKLLPKLLPRLLPKPPQQQPVTAHQQHSQPQKQPEPLSPSSSQQQPKSLLQPKSLPLPQEKTESPQQKSVPPQQKTPLQKQLSPPKQPVPLQ